MFDTNNYTDPMNIAIDYADTTSKQGYIDFYKKIYDVEPNDYLAIGKRIILKNRFPIDIVGLNSSCLQQNGENFRGMGFIGEKQLDEVVRGMRWDEESYAYKILVLHHHIQPVEYWEEPTPGYTYSMCLDAGLLYSFIVKNKIDLIIHGHKHLSSFFQMGKMIAEDKAFYYNILGVGSASSTHLAQDASNSIAVLDFNKPGVVSVKAYAINNRENYDKKGKVIWEYHLPTIRT
jgi:hypothetical protein